MELHKDKRDGWKAETVYPMGDAGHDMHGRPMTRQLHLTTDKRSDGLVTRVTVYSVGPHFRTHAFGFGGSGDFSRAVHKSNDRATEKAVRVQHADAEAMAEIYLKEAANYYASGKNKAA